MRTVSSSGFMLYPQSDGSQSTQQEVATQPQQGMLAEYGGLIKNAIAPTSTSIAEGYNKVYDFATGFDGAPGTNLATGTSSSGTFGGSNIANAAYGYAGGKLANELFDNKGMSDIGGSVGASLGASAAVGSSAIGASMSSLGSFAGPVGAIAGAVLGAAVGSMFGGGGEDYRFRTYSGELGENSQLNTNQLIEKESDWQNINENKNKSFNGFGGQGLSNLAENAQYAANRLAEIEAGTWEPTASETYGRIGKNYKWLKPGNTFSIGDKYTGPRDEDYAGAIDKDWASVDTAFGKYTVGHIDDISGPDEFAQNWVDVIGKIDAAAASILTPEQIEASKVGLSGSIQGTPDWHNESGQNLATDGMIVDRYAAIFELAGRDDLAGELVTAMEAKDEEGNRVRAIPVLVGILESAQQAPRAIVTRSTEVPMPEQAQPTAQPVDQSPAAQGDPDTVPTTTPAPAQAEPSRVSAGRETSIKKPNKQYTITRPEGVINPAGGINYA